MAGSTDNPDILTGLNQVIQALNDLVLTSNCTPQVINNVSMTCNCGSGGASGTAEPSDTDTGDPGDPQGDPPDGFDTWAEYHTYKCNVATKIIDDILTDIDWYAEMAGNNVEITITLFLAAVLTPIPGDEVAILVLLLGAIVAYSTTIYDNMLDVINANYDDFVCILYSAPNATQAESDLQDAFATAMDAETVDPVNRWEGKQAFNYLVNPASVNRLFDKDEALTGKLPTGDCSGCDQCPEYTVLYGTWNPGNGNLQSEYRPEIDRHDATIKFNWDPDASEYCGDPVTVEITEVSGTPYGENGYRIFNQAGTIIYSHESVPPSGPVSNVGMVATYNANPDPYTINIQVS